jgi:hypothetical protein
LPPRDAAQIAAMGPALERLAQRLVDRRDVVAALLQ